MQFCCALFHVLLYKFSIKLHVSAKIGVFSSYGFRETLSGHDRRTDMAKPIFLVVLINNTSIYTLKGVGCLLRPA